MKLIDLKFWKFLIRYDSYNKYYSTLQEIPNPLPLKPPTQHTRKSRNRLVDKVRIHVRGGSGGQGCPSTGGIGGNGGHVFIRCTKGASLSVFSSLQKRRVVAGHGANHVRGSMKIKHGKNSVIHVPPGTEIKSSDNATLADFNKVGEIMKIANGGSGGSPHTIDFSGRKGEKKNIFLELKIIADVALTGFPNAGKSSLLRSLSRARPKVGEYPFTTINPMVGSIFFEDHSQITVADLPGLIEDAHLNKGMGHKFLKHLERTKIVLIVIDVNGFQLNSNSSWRSPVETLLLLLQELALYKDLLLERPFLIVLNKMDTKHSSEMYRRFKEDINTINNNHPLLISNPISESLLACLMEILSKENNILQVSAKDQIGLDVLKKKLYEVLFSHTEPET